MGKHIVIIGSGFGGLGATCRLAAHGHQVEVFEKRDKLGGRGYVYEINGFKFDGGPTVVTAPFMFDDIFKLAGKNREDYFKMVPVNPFYRIFDHQQRHFDYNNDPQFIYEEIRKWNPEDVENYKRFIHSTKNIFYKGFIELADEPFSKVAGMSRVAPDLIRLKSYQIFYRYVASFIKNDFLRQVFSFHPLLVGGNPFDSSSIYAMIHYLEREWGVHFAVGGTGAIVDGLVKLLNDLGGRLHLDSEVAQILVKNGAASGVRLMDGNEVSADIVISNADSSSTYKYLFPPENRKKYTDRRLANLRYSMSLFVIYFGTKRRYTDSALAHHNIILSKRYKDLLNDIFNKKILADDFSLYLHMPTLTDPSLAPEGHEAFYVLSPVPNLEADIDWTKMARPYRDRIMQFLEDNYLPDLQANIVAEHMIDPLHFRDTLNSYKGAAFSVQPILTQSAWFRPHNKSEEMDNLYLVGAGTHPGADLPGVLSSSIVAQKLVQQELINNKGVKAK